MNETDKTYGMVRAIHWVRGLDMSRPILKYLLMVLATYVDNDFECWPSTKTLAADTGQATRSVERQMVELVKLGYVTKVPRFRGNGANTSNIYRLPVQDSHLPGREGVDRMTKESDVAVQEGVTPESTASPTPESTPIPTPESTASPTGESSHEEPLEEPVRRSPSRPPRAEATRSPLRDDETPTQLELVQPPAPDPAPDRFEDFWNAYDHKKGKAHARKAWAAALKKPGVTEDMLVERAAAYRQHYQREQEAKNGTAWSKQYMKHPATWLNGECWDDDVTEHEAPPMSPWEAMRRKYEQEQQMRQAGGY